MFGACQKRSCINITINDDEINEDDESFEVTLQHTSDLDDRIIIAPMTAEINIIDDDCKLNIIHSVLYNMDIFNSAKVSVFSY